MLSKYFCLFPKKNKTRTIKTKQYHQQDRSNDELTFDIDIIKDDYRVNIHERSYHYSDYDGNQESYSSYYLSLNIYEDSSEFMTVLYVDKDGAHLLESNSTNIKYGYLTFVSSQKFALPKEKMEENLWKILYSFKYQISVKYESYGARELKECDEYIKTLLKYYFDVKEEEVHFLLFHQFYYYGDQYEGLIEEKAQAYGFDIDAIFTVCKEMIERIEQGIEEYIIPQDVIVVNEDDVPRNVHNVIFHDRVAVIGSQTFYSNPYLKNIILPDSVKEIKYGAFMYCYALEELRLSNKLKYIEAAAFSDCHNLSGALIIPPRVKKIFSRAFYGCSKLTEIILPEGLLEIGKKAFEDCRGVETIIIPKTVAYIGNDAFKGCSKLTKVIMPRSFKTEHCFGNSILDKEKMIIVEVKQEDDNMALIKIFGKYDNIEFEFYDD